MLSILRGTLGPVSIGVLFFYGHLVAAVLVFIFFAFTDFLDGYLARRWNATTLWGKVLDPFADKVFIILLIFFVGLPAEQKFQIWCLIGAELFLACIGSYALKRARKEGGEWEKKVGANIWGKTKFWIEVIFVLLLFGRKLGLDPGLNILIPTLWLAVGAAILSIGGYWKKLKA